MLPMGRDGAQNLFARTLAVFGLAATISIGLAGVANAAPADRGGDPVVLKGSGLGDLIGTEPGKIVGFKWDGQWTQIPVQVDERHTISARQLYPDEPKVGYIDPGEPFLPTFDIEVYADPKTRSGADEDPMFDADDEFTFMGGDAGSDAPADVDPPSGVDGASGVKVAVDDPVGGGSAAVYLFKSTGDLDPSAGKDYVDYDFKLTNLTDGQTLKDDYGYIHSTNPEDSTVKTADYELHSVDRWMEDELKVKTGNSNGADILDRETAQAYLNQCGRSQYTFSGRWTEDTNPSNNTDTDDEGTYVAAIDGPVRAIRSYMGANSGPYTQREHIYYADQEVNTIFLRVHLMQDLYSWTDYSDAAIGMTYRDQNNTAGVPVDGNPDSLDPITTDDITAGNFAWQQLSGPQGTVSTVMGSQTDFEDPAFGSYYLDDSTPVGSNEVQCGGDGKSIGASGFGILGVGGLPITPNTDPRNTGGFGHLTVQRTRYFGPPSDGATQAANYTDRVEKPLAASASANPVTGGPNHPGGGGVLHARLKIKFTGKKAKARKGKAYRVKVKVANTGKIAARKAKVCVRGAQLKARGTCRKIGSVPAGAARVVTVKVKVKPRAGGRKLRLKVTASARSTKPASKRRVTTLKR
jgi:hypothetical protein